MKGIDMLKEVIAGLIILIGIFGIILIELQALQRNIDGVYLSLTVSGIISIVSIYFGKWVWRR